MKNRKVILLTISSLVLTGCSLPTIPFGSFDLSTEKEQSSLQSSEESLELSSGESSVTSSEESSITSSEESSIPSYENNSSSAASSSYDIEHIHGSNEYSSYIDIPELLIDEASAVDYDFDPSSLIIKESEVYDFGSLELSSIEANTIDRGGCHLVCHFEGSYAEGYQGDYSETYGNIYLWEDGLFTGTIKGTSIKGYWYNSSLSQGTDAQGNDIKDCLELVSSTTNYNFISAYATDGFYSYQTSVYLNMGWGTRTMQLNGYYYYPTIGIAVDLTGVGGHNFKVGDYFSSNALSAVKVLSNLSYVAISKPGAVSWTIPSDMLNSRSRFDSAGTYFITATYQGFIAGGIICVTE